jgi:hypothetical protein
MSWHVVIIHKAMPFKIIVSYWQQTALNSRKRRDGSWFWGFETTLRSARQAVCLSVCLSVCICNCATTSRPLSHALGWLLAPPRAVVCDVVGYSQCLDVLRGASVQRRPSKATHFLAGDSRPTSCEALFLITSWYIKSDSCVWGGVVKGFGRGQHCLLMDWWLGLYRV